MVRARFHEQHPELVEVDMTASQAETALCIMDVLQNHEGGSEHDSLWDWFNHDQGAYATRSEIRVAAVVIDAAWEELNAEYPDGSLGDEVMDAIGCWDFEWIPAMIDAWMNNPAVDFAQHTRQLIATYKAQKEDGAQS